MQKKKTYTLEEAQKKLEYYCAYQERCHLEVVKKLEDMGMIQLVIDQIVGHLIHENYLNESRFAQSFARGKFRIKKWGKQRIIRELKNRQLSEFTIRLGLKEISEEDYTNTLYKLTEKFWMNNAHLTLHKRKKKVVDALRFRGWESNLIFMALADLEADLQSK